MASESNLLLGYQSYKKFLKSNSYKIRFFASDVDEPTLESLKLGLSEQVGKLANNGWRKTGVKDNEMMFGLLYNLFVLYQPEGLKVNVSYGLSISSMYFEEKNEYKVTISAD